MSRTLRMLDGRRPNREPEKGPGPITLLWLNPDTYVLHLVREGVAMAGSTACRPKGPAPTTMTRRGGLREVDCQLCRRAVYYHQVAEGRTP